MVGLIESYLKEKEDNWAETTRRTVKHTLMPLAPYLTGNPEVLWKHLVTFQAPYSRLSTWKVVCSFWDYAHPHTENPYREWRKKKKLLFKNVYIRRPAKESVKEALEKVNSLDDAAIKRKALELLYSGMRYTESFTLKEGMIIGKGGKPRQVFLQKIEGPDYKGSYRTFLRALQKVGLTPHGLRKIALSEAINKGGANVIELMTLAGWSSLDTARSYCEANPVRLKAIMESIRK